MTRLQVMLVCLAVAAAAAASLHIAAQEPTAPPAGGAPGAGIAPPGGGQGIGYEVGGYGSTGMVSPAQAEQSSQKRVSAALKSFGAAEGDEQRATAEKELQDAVGAQFEVLMMSREAQITELKERLDRLTAQLEKRRNAKDEIVKLRVQVLIKESQGLGFYPEGTAPWPGMGTGMTSGGYGGDEGMSPVPNAVPGYPGTAPRQSR